MPRADEGPFLKEERKLIDTIAERLAHFLMQRRLQATLRNWQSAMENLVVAREARVVGHHRVPAQDRPAPADADLAPHAQLPVLERHRRGAGAAAAASRPTSRRPTEGVRGQHPAAAQEHRRSAGADRRRVRDRRHAPERGRDRRRASRSGSRTTSRGSSSRRSRTSARRSPTSAQALERYHQLAVQDEELSRSVQIGLRVSLARRFFTEDLEFINTAKNYIEIGDFYELVHHIISPPASHGKLGGKSVGHAARLADHPQVRRVLRPARRHQGAEDVVHHVGRPHELRRVQPARGRLQPEVPRDRADPPRVPAHRAGVQELALRAGDHEGAVAGARRPRGQAAHRPQLEPARGPDGRGVLGQVQEPVPAERRHQGRAAQRADGRDRRGLRVAVRPRPDRVPRRAQPPRPPRGDGDHDPGGGRQRASAPTSCRRSPASPSATTSSAGRRASSARTAWCASCRASARARSIASATTTRSSSRPASPGCASTSRRTRSCATRRGRSTSSTSRRGGSRRSTSPTCSREYGREYPALDQIASVYDRDGIHRPVGFGWDPRRVAHRASPSTA